MTRPFVRSIPASPPRLLAATTLGLCLAVVAVSCSDPLVFADWTIPVSEDTRVVEYADATDEDRDGNRIEIEEDLVIGPRGYDDNYRFFNPMSVGVDTRGNVYVLDGGNARIQVFDADGDYLRTLGDAGSGPGEFRPAQGGFSQVEMVVAGDDVVAYDAAQSRISVWGSDGEHLGDHALTDLRIANFLTGRADGSVVAEVVQRTDDGSMRAAVDLSGNGEPQHTYVSLPRAGNFMVGRLGLANPTGEAVFAAAGDGAVYASAGIEYQLLAFGADGPARWALRVAHQRAPLSEDDRAHVLDILTHNFPDLDASDTDWPSHIGSIGSLAVDGHGHLYVFFMRPPLAEAPEEVEVDVYAPDGGRLFTGTMPALRWTDAAGDFAYALRRNEETDEDEPVRYRLLEPFE